MLPGPKSFGAITLKSGATIFECKNDIVNLLSLSLSENNIEFF
jgi:hypothetical protein